MTMPTTPEKRRRRMSSAILGHDREATPDTEQVVRHDHARHRFNNTAHLLKLAPLASIILVLLFAIIWRYLAADTRVKKIFLSLFFFRYTRLVVNTISWRLAKPWPVFINTPDPEEASVIVPTTDATAPKVERCILSALDSGASKVIVSTYKIENFDAISRIRQSLGYHQQARLEVVDSQGPNKRRQLVIALKKVTTQYVVFKDDHVFWPTRWKYLQAILAPFEDEDVGGVGTNKRVIRAHHKLWPPSAWKFWNFIGCLYLERHNMETVSTNRIDGGVWVISGRTCAYRTDIMKRRDFQHAFLNEYVLLNPRLGPMNTDDDLFISRWMATQGYKLFFQIGEDAMMHTTIDVGWQKLLSKLLRWYRGPWGRSNFKSLLEGKRIWRHPWTYYAVHISGCLSFALVWDPALVLFVYFAASRDPTLESHVPIVAILGWIVGSKLVKLMPHFWRHPSDALLFPLYCLFAYFMTLIKLYSMWTLRISVGEAGKMWMVLNRRRLRSTHWLGRIARLGPNISKTARNFAVLRRANCLTWADLRVSVASLARIYPSRLRCSRTS